MVDLGRAHDALHGHCLLADELFIGPRKSKDEITLAQAGVKH